MIAKGIGTVVNVVAYEGTPPTAIYAATKSATRSMARSVAQEIPPGAPVHAFSLVPGIVDTPLIHDVLLPQMSQVMGMPVDVLLAGLAINPGYAGLVPPYHCATALIYCLAHAEEYNAQVADPISPSPHLPISRKLSRLPPLTCFLHTPSPHPPASPCDQVRPEKSFLSAGDVTNVNCQGVLFIR